MFVARAFPVKLKWKQSHLDTALLEHRAIVLVYDKQTRITALSIGLRWEVVVVAIFASNA